MDESKFNSEYILPVVKRILDRYAERKSYWTCKWEPTKPLTEDQYSYCRKALSVSRKDDSFNPQSEYRLECCVISHYEDRWLVKKTDEFDFNVLLKEDIDLAEKTTEIDISMISIDKFIEFIRLISSQLQGFDDGSFLVPSHHSRNLLYGLVRMFSTIIRIRIIPNKNVVAGLPFDIFGIKKNILAQRGIESTSQISKEIQKEYEELESREVHSRIVNALKTKYDLGDYNEEMNFFELPYEQVPLDEITKKFYFKCSVCENADLSQRSFLEVQSRRFRPYCSPELAEAKNEVLDFPSFGVWEKSVFTTVFPNKL